MATEQPAATAVDVAADPIHSPCPHCGVAPANTPDPMGALIACLRAVVEAQAPRVVAPRVVRVPGWSEVEQTNWEA